MDVNYSDRVWRLMYFRGITLRAARIVVDAAMYGLHCTEGTIRAQVEANKKKPQT